MNDSLKDIIQQAFGECIEQWEKEGLSLEKIEEKVNSIDMDKLLQELTDTASKDFTLFFKEKMFEISYKRKIEFDKFIAHQNEIWGECFAASETMYVIATEAAEEYSTFVDKNISNKLKAEKQYTFMALQYMQGRCCQEFLEILHLMKLGFADCAYARWRSMYELCCNASFIIKHGELIAKQYIEQSQTEDHHYTWTKGAKSSNGNELKITTFQGIQDNCDVPEAWKKQYKLSCFINHGSPQGTFKRMCLLNEESMVIIGQSDYGITTPAEHSAISLQWITSMFLKTFPCLDAVAYIKVLHDWVKEIRKIYFDTSDKCFDTNINYAKEKDYE